MSLLVDIEKRLGNFMLRSKFEASSGTMALLGASGCGKSVTLHCGHHDTGQWPHCPRRRDTV